MLNHYLDLQSTIIHANGGDVDKFVGDEVMAMFEGARKEINACKASLEIRKAMAEEKELAELAKRNFVSIGIGINTGPVVHGSMGAKDRMDFTSIGDTVNLAARLEGTNKEYATKTLITEAVYEKVQDAFLCREIDLVTVKGKSRAGEDLRAPAGEQVRVGEAGPHEEALRNLAGAVPQAEVGCRGEGLRRPREGFQGRHLRDVPRAGGRFQEESSRQRLGRGVPPHHQVGNGGPRRGARCPLPVQAAAFVVDDDEGGQVTHANPSHRLHAQLRPGEHFV